jgi:hypothetical protein
LNLRIQRRGGTADDRERGGEGGKTANEIHIVMFLMEDGLTMPYGSNE